MKKILYISGTRADYGLMRETLLAIRRHPKLKVEIVATGMHLMPEFGNTIDEVRKDNFKIHRIEAVYKRDNKESMANFIGEFVLKLTKAVKQIKPDIILVLGDRAEMVAGAIVGAYLTIPVAHIGGGDVTSTVDEIARHAITKLSHIHLVATKKVRERIIKMGEDPWRVYRVGAPGLDSIVNEKLFSKKEIAKKYKLNLREPILLFLQHPVSIEIEDAAWQMKQTMEAIKELGYQTIVIYPNADAGGRKMIKVIEKYRKYPFIQIYKNIPHKDFLSLMTVANVMVGNSSSGIVEAPSFSLPVVNIGIRQQGREKAANVIDTKPALKEIIKAIRKALYDEKFKEKVKKCKNPYGDGKASARIAKILNLIKIDKKLLQKKIAY
jgi:UDP-hydrolysing UDP-N-acetyl-D-glucosamine 2-epimerase